MKLVTAIIKPFKLDYVPQKEDGSAMPAVQMTWNIAKNTASV